jgi:hypothetical protein
VSALAGGKNGAHTHLTRASGRGAGEDEGRALDGSRTPTPPPDLPPLGGGIVGCFPAGGRCQSHAPLARCAGEGLGVRAFPLTRASGRGAGGEGVPPHLTPQPPLLSPVGEERGRMQGVRWMAPVHLPPS